MRFLLTAKQTTAHSEKLDYIDMDKLFVCRNVNGLRMANGSKNVLRAHKERFGIMR